MYCRQTFHRDHYPGTPIPRPSISSAAKRNLAHHSVEFQGFPGRTAQTMPNVAEHKLHPETCAGLRGRLASLIKDCPANQVPTYLRAPPDHTRPHHPAGPGFRQELRGFQLLSSNHTWAPSMQPRSQILSYDSHPLLQYDSYTRSGYAYTLVRFTLHLYSMIHTHAWAIHTRPDDSLTLTQALACFSCSWKIPHAGRISSLPRRPNQLDPIQ